MIGDIEAWLFGTLVQPAIYWLGLMAYIEDAFQWTEFALLGVVQVVVTYLICRPLEAWRPVEPRTDARAIRTDVIYTMLQRLGLLPLLFFVLFTPVAAWVDGLLREAGYVPRTIDQWLPALADQPLVTFLIYALVLDFAEYWRHRLQHGLNWWWALHQLHHDQRQMTLWSDNRNHVLDDVTQAAWMGAVAQLIGVEPGQFPLLVLAFGLVESLSHVNARLSFGRIGDRILTSPRFHREHHAIAFRPGEPARACNFAALFPLWDMLFGTARFDGRYAATGVEGRTTPAAIGRGWFRQQWLGVERLVRALVPARLLGRDRGIEGGRPA